MPGVPPDALAQVKKGLRGLFGRKKTTDTNHNNQQAQAAPQHATPTSQEQPASSTTSAAPATAAAVPEITRTEPSPPIADAVAPPPADSQIPESTALAEAKNFDLNPDAPTAAAITASKPASAPVPTKVIEQSNGMSATSGPMDDGMAHGYVDSAVDGATGDKGVSAVEGETRIEREIMTPETHKLVGQTEIGDSKV